MKRIYNLNENYFEVLDTPEKAYILGFIYADGYNREDLLELVQNIERRDIIDNIKKALQAEHPIKEYTPGRLTLNIGSTKLCKDLINLGAFRNKSLSCTFPDFIQEPLMSSFILGYFDGDGCVWDGKRKKMIIKDSSRASGYRERIVHNVKFTFTGNYLFINALQDYLVKLGIVNKKTKLNFSKAKNPDTNTCDKVCSMEYSGRKQLRNLYDYMYKSSPIWCKEKKEKFIKIFCASKEKYLEDTSLTAGTPEMEISNQASIIEEGSSTIPEMGVESSDSKCEAPNT